MNAPNIWGRHEDRYRRPSSIRGNFHDPGGKKERLVGARCIRSRHPDSHRLGAGRDPAAGALSRFSNSGSLAMLAAMRRPKRLSSTSVPFVTPLLQPH
jgi:hypothetical protein